MSTYTPQQAGRIGGLRSIARLDSVARQALARAGGNGRAAKLSPADRSRIARRAARARWTARQAPAKSVKAS